jgi:FkbM family methyltransferase
VRLDQNQVDFHQPASRQRILRSLNYPRLQKSIATHRNQFHALGLRGWLQLQAHLRSPRLAAAFGHRLWPKTAAHPVRYRPGESDLTVFWQIFLEREYSSLDDVRDPGLIVDCGANVGYSSVYFLSRFPFATVIALEPDDGNFALLRENTAPFGSRAKLLQAAVWSRPCRLAFAEDGYRNGQAWAIQVRESAEPGKAAIPAIDLGTVLRDSGHDRISILKVDIERAELEVFGPGCREWLDRCDNIVVELHDAECEAMFAKAVAGQGFETSRHGELTVCMRRPDVVSWPLTAPRDAGRRRDK